MLIGHGADRLGAERRDGVVHGALKPLQTVAFETDQCLGADDDIVEGQFPRRGGRRSRAASGVPLDRAAGERAGAAGSATRT
jgi:hypothetical protein